MERRDFLKASALGAAGLMIPAGMLRGATPAAPAAKSARKAASDKIHL